MNKEIEELAAREYPILSNNSDHKVTQILRQQGFIKGAELALGFAEWLQWNRIEYAGMHSLWKYKGNTITTTDLFTQYLNTKK